MDTMVPDPRFASDLRWAKQAAAGSESHWHALVEQYTPLLKTVIRRYVRDDDEVGAIWAGLLERFRLGLLDHYRGQSSLATWLAVVARSVACDHVRSIRGRRRLPPQLEGKPAIYAAAYTEVFLLGRGPIEATHRLREQELLPPDISLAEIVAELEDMVDDRTLRRIAFDVQADQVGVASGYLLEFLDHEVEEARRAQRDLSPDQNLLQSEARRTLDRIQDIISGLPDAERRVVKLRFRRGWSARRIAQAMNLKNSREVYTISDRAIRLIRKFLAGNMLSVFFTFFVGKA